MYCRDARTDFAGDRKPNENNIVYETTKSIRPCRGLFWCRATTCACDKFHVPDGCQWRTMAVSYRVKRVFDACTDPRTRKQNDFRVKRGLKEDDDVLLGPGFVIEYYFHNKICTVVSKRNGVEDVCIILYCYACIRCMKKYVEFRNISFAFTFCDGK